MVAGLLLAGGCVFQASAQGVEEVSVLAIGNSFSEDALDYHFQGLCEAAGKRVTVGNLYIPGCPLERHLLNARTDSAAYRMRLFRPGQAMKETHGVRLSEAIAGGKWDYVSFQQASGVSGKYATFAGLGPLMEYVDSVAGGNGPRYLWHQTWAYSENSDHGEFPNYGSDQHVMYDSIMAASRRVMADYGKMERMVPSGTAVQIAREVSGDHNLTRGGYHLSLLTGRYIAACAWFETLLGESVVGNGYVPEGMTAEEARLAQEAAHAACRPPFIRR